MSQAANSLQTTADPRKPDALTIELLATQVAELTEIQNRCDAARVKTPKEPAPKTGPISKAVLGDMEEEASTRRFLAQDFIATLEPRSPRECLVVAVFAAERAHLLGFDRANQSPRSVHERNEWNILELYLANLVTGLQAISGVTLKELGLEGYMPGRDAAPFETRAAAALAMAEVVEKAEAARAAGGEQHQG